MSRDLLGFSRVSEVLTILDRRGFDGQDFRFDRRDEDAAWINQGAATVARTRRGTSFMTAAADSTDAIKMRVWPIPPQPYTITMRFEFSFLSVNYVAGGLILIDNTDAGRNFGVEHNTNLNLVAYTTNSSHVVSAASPRDAKLEGFMPAYLRAQDDGTNRILSFGRNGENFILFQSESRTATVTPTKFGWYLNVRNSGSAAGIELLSLVVTNP